MSRPSAMFLEQLVQYVEGRLRTGWYKSRCWLDNDNELLRFQAEIPLERVFARLDSVRGLDIPVSDFNEALRTLLKRRAKSGLWRYGGRK